MCITKIKINSKEDFEKICQDTEYIEVTNNVEEIPNSAFSNFHQLAKIEIADSVTKIGKFAFFNCETIEEIAIPNPDAEVEPNAFARCKELEKLTIGRTIENFEDNAFASCNNLKEIRYNGTKAQYVKIIKEHKWFNGAKEKEQIKIIFSPPAGSLDDLLAMGKSFDEILNNKDNFK